MVHDVLIALLYIAFIVVSVFTHEYGHMLAYRLFGTRVDQLAIGFGPALLKRKDRYGTEWSIRPIPLGGYVKAPYSERLRPTFRGMAALAGPVGSMLLASFAFTLNTIWQNEHLLWLAYANATMAIFNLLPLPPLDGGRIMLAWLEAKKGKEWLKPREDYFWLGGFAMVWALMLIVLPLSHWKMVPPPREKIVKVVEKERTFVSATTYRPLKPGQFTIYYVNDEPSQVWQEAGYMHEPPQGRTHPITGRRNDAFGYRANYGDHLREQRADCR